MAFNRKQKTLDEVLRLYQISYQDRPFEFLTDFEMPQKAKEDIWFTIDKLDYKSSEGAIREYVISPILREAWRRYADHFLLWVERAISYDKELSGVPDYIISRRSERGKIFFESPHIAVVEAKKDDFIGGWSQCALEMIAISKINNDKNVVFGVVTNGDTWEIASLSDDIFTKFQHIFVLNKLDELHNALCSIFELFNRM